MDRERPAAVTLYDTLYLASSPLTAAYFLYKRQFRGKYRESLPAMMGKRLPLAPQPSVASTGRLIRTDNGAAAGLRVWVHAVSVGEVVAAHSVIIPLLEARPDATVLVSTVTETGQATAKRLLGGVAREILYHPLDLSWIVRRFLDAYRPDVYVMMETELWPNMLTEAGRRGVKILMLNGRLSDRSYPWYRRFGFLFRGPLSNIAACAVQTPTDAERLRSLCSPATPVAVTGNCKFDSPAERLDAASRIELLRKWNISPERQIVVAGSTHPGEEEAILSAWQAIRASAGGATLIVAPRHVERAREIESVVLRNGFTCSRSSSPGQADPDVLLLDEMGVLARAYGLGVVAIVGGSFVPIGGHNILEPAAHAIPVIYGPHMHKQREMLRLLDAEHGGVPTTVEQLAPALLQLLQDEPRRIRLGQLALAAIEANRGSARRSVEFILPFLPAQSPRYGSVSPGL